MDSQPTQPEPRRPGPLAWLFAIATLAMAAVAVWFRCRWLGHVPGINGDEAWYGVKALEMLQQGSYWVRTPTGNPPNPFYLGPLVLLHAWFPPSVVLLRCVAVASGLVALGINWLLCRWVFDRATATLSTMMLAVCPTMIAYSRFGWDASQSVLATLPVVYLSLATVRFPQRRAWLAAATAVALLAAVWVHPTNIFTGAMALAATAAWRLRKQQTQMANDSKRRRRKIAAAAVVLTVVGLSAVCCGIGSDTPQRWLARAGGVEDLVHRGGLWQVPGLVARLHTGGTAYRYIPGSQSWLQWPAAEASPQWGIDVVLFWAAAGVAGVVLWRSGRRSGRVADRVLLAGWGATLLGFLVVAGPSALLPGWERYAMCLIGPSALVLARAAVLVHRAASDRRRLVLASSAVLVGWLMLADFEAQYFQFFRKTAGAAHPTFRTGPVEPRAAALALIDEHRGDTSGNDARRRWVVTSEWWNYWPTKYLAADRPGVQVIRWEDVKDDDSFRSALREGRVWLVEFAGGAAERQAAAKAVELGGRIFRRRLVRGYAGQPVLAVLEVR